MRNQTMMASSSFDQAHSFVRKATRPGAGDGQTLGMAVSRGLLVSLVIVVIIVVLLLSQGDLGVGMAP
jgi:hypothetical protein